MDGNKLWIKILLEKRRGRFTKLVEAMNFLGYEFTDIHVTSFRGAILISCCVEVPFSRRFNYKLSLILLGDDHIKSMCAGLATRK